MYRFASLVLLGMTGLFLVAGCSSRKSGDMNPTRTDELQQVANMLREHHASFNRGPANAADLARFQNDFPFGYNQVKSGEIVVVWGATMGGEGGGGSDGVIAYEKKAPGEGGMVLLANGTVKQMSAAEFNSAPKATK